MIVPAHLSEEALRNQRLEFEGARMQRARVFLQEPASERETDDADAELTFGCASEHRAEHRTTTNDGGTIDLLQVIEGIESPGRKHRRHHINRRHHSNRRVGGPRHRLRYPTSPKCTETLDHQSPATRGRVRPHPAVQRAEVVDAIGPATHRNMRNAIDARGP